MSEPADPSAIAATVAGAAAPANVERTLTRGACRCSSPTVGSTRGVSAAAATAASCSGVMLMISSGSSAATEGSRETDRVCRRPALRSRCARPHRA